MIGNETFSLKSARPDSGWKSLNVAAAPIGLLCCYLICCNVVTAQEIAGQDELWTRKSGSDWPGFLGVNRDGKSPEQGILKDWSNGRLKKVWEIDTGEGYGIGSVAGGRYFHFDRQDGNARLRCIQAETGKLIWDFSYPSVYRDMYGYDSGPRASPLIEQDRVFIYGVEGELHCLNAITGTQVWRVGTAKSFGVIQNFFGVGSSPAILGDTLLVMVGGSGGEPGTVQPTEMPDVQPAGSAVVGFDTQTGRVKFKAGDDLASYSSIKVAKFNGHDIALAWARNRLLGIDPISGRVDFEFDWRARDLESVNASTPVVNDGKIFLTECYGPGGVLLDYGGGEPSEVWSDKKRRKKSLSAHWNTPVLHQGFLYGSSGRNSGDATLRCVELATGKVAWSKDGFSRASATLIDGHLIVLGEYGELALIKATAEQYVEVTRLGPESGIKLGAPCWAAPIVSHGLMIVRGKNKVVCFDLIPNK